MIAIISWLTVSSPFGPVQLFGTRKNFRESKEKLFAKKLLLMFCSAAAVVLKNDRIFFVRLVEKLKFAKHLAVRATNRCPISFLLLAK